MPSSLIKHRNFQDKIGKTNGLSMAADIVEQSFGVAKKPADRYALFDRFLELMQSCCQIVVTEGKATSRIRGADLSFLFAEFLSIQRRLDGVDQCIFAERLEQEIHRASGDGLYPLLLVRAGGNKNDWNTTVSARQISLQFQAIHSRHPKVED